MKSGKCRGIITLRLLREKRDILVEPAPEEKIMDLLRKAGIPLDGVLVFMGNVPLPLDDDVEGVDELTVVTVASGG